MSESYNELAHVDRFFEEVQDDLINPMTQQTDHILNLKPLPHEFSMLDWRYRLIGFVESLLINNQYALEHYEKLKFDLFGPSALFQEKRLGRERQFNIQVTTKDGRHFDFDVAAKNAHDAYHQLAKRLSYRAIPDVNQVDIFSGKLSQRHGSDLLYSFKETELIHIHLWK